MPGTPPVAEGANRAGDVYRTVRKATTYWARAGLSPSVRRRKAEELSGHLHAAVADGRSVHDVVGSDVAAFAAEWAEADRERNWVEPVLLLTMLLTVPPGLLALLGPIATNLDSTGIDAQVAMQLVVVMLGAFGIHLVRWFRAGLTAGLARFLYVLIVAVQIASILWIGRVTDPDSVVSMSPLVAVALIVVGATSQAVATWMKRTRRL